MKSLTLKFNLDAFLNFGLKLAASISAGILVVILVFVAFEAWPSLTTGLSGFLTDESWNPTTGQKNLLPMLIGSLAICVGSLCVTFPLGVGAAIFVNFYCPPFAQSGFRRLLEILSGIPSVVFGLWGIAVVVPWVAEVSPLGQGQSLLAGIVIVSMMTVPLMAFAVDSALKNVPGQYIRAAAALGIERRAIIWLIALPAARVGILTGGILQIARALGETMAVLMVCGNVVKTPGSLFDPVRTLTANVALEMGYAEANHRSALFVSGLLLLLLVGCIVVFVNLLAESRPSVAPVRGADS